MHTSTASGGGGNRIYIKDLFLSYSQQNPRKYQYLQFIDPLEFLSAKS